jgi:hypothetical protein
MAPWLLFSPAKKTNLEKIQNALVLFPFFFSLAFFRFFSFIFELLTKAQNIFKKLGEAARRGRLHV